MEYEYFVKKVAQFSTIVFIALIGVALWISFEREFIQGEVNSQALTKEDSDG